MKKTTICVMDTTVDKIKSLKVHPRQSCESVVIDLIRFWKNNPIESIDCTYELKRGE